MRHSLNAVSMLAQRLYCWPNIETALSEYPCLVRRQGQLVLVDGLHAGKASQCVSGTHS